MLRLALIIAGAGWFTLTPVWAQEALEPRLRKLEKEIAAVRGLEFKSPVVGKIISRPRDADRSIQGYYSIKDKVLFVYDDIKTSYARGTLIHEMVHALQDQHFKLAKLHQTGFDSDGELAHAALIEGDATYTMIELLQKEQPKAGAMLEVPLAKAKNLRNAFLYAQGARYVKALKERGGWAAVNSAYKFLPRSTAAILHPEGVKTVDLGPGKVRGEYGLIEMLRGHAETAPLAVEAAAGWQGDRFIEHGNGTSWVIAMSTPEAAKRCRDAIRQQMNLDEAMDTISCWTRGNRVFVVASPEAKVLVQLRERMEGPPSVVVYTRTKQRLAFGTLLEELLKADLVCVGETHDNDLHHQVQLQIVKGLHACDERLGIGMEMFQRPFQKYLDSYLRGEVGEAHLLKTTEYQQRWGYEWSLYQPIVEFARRNRLPIAALNAPKELTSRISKGGLAQLTAEEKKQLGDVDFHVPAHRKHWFDLLGKMHGSYQATPEQKERSYQVMTTWDDYMAQSAALFQKERRLRRLVVLAGSGHIDRGFGIPDRAARRTGGKALTVQIIAAADPAQVKLEPVTDYVVIVTP